MRATDRDKIYCGIGSWTPAFLERFATVQWFTVFASFVTAMQGLYLGYVIGVLTTIEKRFEIPSYMSGALLSVYDVGHALSVLLVGYYGARMHQPRWVAVGAFLSSFACFGLMLPHLIFGESRGTHAASGQVFTNTTTVSDNDFASKIVSKALCITENFTNATHGYDNSNDCTGSMENMANKQAYIILVLFQIVAGLASSPFTTLVYVYIDDNATRKQSPFYLGVMTAMWAYGPALGFGLSSYTSHLWITLKDSPSDLTPESPEWIGAWWLGFVVLTVLYAVAGVPFLFYPRSLKRVHQPAVDKAHTELLAQVDLKKPTSLSNSKEKSVRWCLSKLADIPIEIFTIVRNPMFATMCLSWIMTSFLIGGYSTFLPKYLEVVFYQPTFIANILGGIVAIIGVATSTAIGGKVLSCLNQKAPKSILLVLCCYIVSLMVYIALMFIGCDNVPINGLQPGELKSLVDSENFSAPVCHISNMRLGNHTFPECACNPTYFSPVCDRNSQETYFSPCYAGCTYGNKSHFTNCTCASGPGAVETGYCGATGCGSKLTIYLAGAFVGGGVGAFFQMALFTNLLWAMPQEKKTNVVALSNFFCGVFGFMISQLVFGKLMDSTCTVWSVNPKAGCGTGYCLLYDNSSLRYRYHATTAAFQFASILFVAAGYFVSRSYKFPERQEDGAEIQEDHKTGDNDHDIRT